MSIGSSSSSQATIHTCVNSSSSQARPGHLPAHAVGLRAARRTHDGPLPSDLRWIQGRSKACCPDLICNYEPPEFYAGSRADLCLRIYDGSRADLKRSETRARLIDGYPPPLHPHLRQSCTHLTEPCLNGAMNCETLKHTPCHLRTVYMIYRSIKCEDKHGPVNCCVSAGAQPYSQGMWRG